MSCRTRFGHGKKDLQTDLLLIAVTGVPLHAAAFGLWRLGVYFEAKIARDTQ